MNTNFLQSIKTRLSPGGESIRQRLDSIRELDPKAYSQLLEHIEFDFMLRQKLRMRRIIRKFILRRSDTKGHVPSRGDFVSYVNNPDNEKVVLFVARHPTHDFLKASDYLRRQGGYQTALLMFHPTLRPVMEEHFDAVWVYPSFYDLCTILTKLDPWIVHAQGSSSFYPFPVLAKALTNAPVVTEVMYIPSLFRTQEQMSGKNGGPDLLALESFMERYPYQHTEAVTLFNLQMSSVERLREEASTPAPTIEFHNYPSIHDCVKPKTRQINGDGIHIVYAGVAEPSSLPREHFGDLDFNSLIKTVTDQGLHFHMYPSPHYEPSRLRKYLQEYVDTEEVNPFFHYHDPIAPGKTAEVLSQYHYASMMYTLDQVPEHDFISIYKNAGGIGSKFFTYLEAGLPIIVDRYAVEPARMVEKYGSGVLINEDQLGDLGTILQSQRYDELVGGVTRAQESLSLEKQATGLQDLYEQAGRSQPVRPRG